MSSEILISEFEKNGFYEAKIKQVHSPESTKWQELLTRLKYQFLQEFNNF